MLRSSNCFVAVLALLVGCGGPPPPTPPAACASVADCNDADACTIDVCWADGTCTNVPAQIDDFDACTDDACDAATGIAHTPIAGIDDGDVCTTDLCDPSNGVITHADLNIDDSNACTFDFCDSIAGVSHTLIFGIDDGDSCTVDACDTATGVITHDPVPVDDGDPCTIDTCDPATGAIAHTAVDVDDSDACTADACDPATGVVSHLPPFVDDGIACTADACDAATGIVSHTPNAAACDDGVSCTDDSCSAVSGCSNAPNAANCGPGQICNAASGCQAVPALAQAIITEFRALGTSGNAGELIEIHNPTAAGGDVAGFTFMNLAGTATIRAPSDPTGALGTAVIVAAGGYAYGVANPIDPATLPPGVAFVYGDPGTAFELADGGDVLHLHDRSMAILDAVDFSTPGFVTDPALPVAPGQFPGSAAASTQLDPLRLSASANDSGDAWCVTFRRADTAGLANGSCSDLVINEVLYDFDHPVVTALDDNRVFVEIAGPGGASLQGWRILGVDGDGVGNQEPDVTIGVTAGVISATRMPVDGFFVIADAAADNGPSLVPNADLTLGAGNPINGNGNGDAVQLFDPTGTLVDLVGYGAATAAEGSAVVDVDPDEVAISIARDALGTDTNDNAADFHYDPTPTPGGPNLAVAPAILTVTPDDGLATAPAQVILLVRDFADWVFVPGAAAADNDVDGTFAGAGTADTALTTDGCDFLDVADEGRGVATLSCLAPANAGVVVRGDLVLANPVALGLGNAVVANGWTYTGVLNETDLAAEADFCNLQFPPTFTVTQGSATPPIYGRIYEAGLTEAAGDSGSVLAELGAGPTSVDPTLASGWLFLPAAYNVQVGNDDEYVASFVAPAVAAATSFSYTYRMSFDGGLTFTYCDLDGAGANTGLIFESTQLGAMLVNP